MGATALAIVVLAAAWWFLWVPAWRPGLEVGERYGIDVSDHQGTITWARVADDHIRFVYIKATEGSDHVDERFASNWAGAGRAGLQRGVYHFFTFCSSGSDQARNFLAVAAPDGRALAPAVDLELAGNCTRRPTEETVLRELTTFLTTVEAAWHRPVLLYVGADFQSRYHVEERLRRPRWLQRFLLRPEGRTWTVWQAQGHASVSGIPGQVDLDVMRPTP